MPERGRAGYPLDIDLVRRHIELHPAALIKFEEAVLLFEAARRSKLIPYPESVAEQPIRNRKIERVETVAHFLKDGEISRDTDLKRELTPCVVYAERGFWVSRVRSMVSDTKPTIQINGYEGVQRRLI